jgi:endonuclease-8
MPEGHTIHRLARDQSRDLVGHKVRASSPQGRFAASAALIDGSTVERIDAFGKHLFHRFDDGQRLHVHLGLIGKFKRCPAPVPDPVGQVRLRLEGPVAAWDLAGPMFCRLVTPDEVDAITRKLGPDPLRRDADPQRFVDRVLRSPAPIGALLLDQSVVAGIGNVYRAEVLFLHGIDPRTPGRELNDEQVRALWDELVLQLRDGLKRNRIITIRAEERDRPMSRMTREDALYVYHRDVCRRCGGPVVPITVAARRIDMCSTCQR